MSEVYFTDLCSSRSPDWSLWSSKIGWDTPDPDITLCFQYTILNWVPLLFLWVSCSIYIPLICGKRSITYQKAGKFNIFKCALIGLLLLIHILNLCKTIGDSVNRLSPPHAMYLQPVLSIISSALLIYLNRLIFSKGIHTSGVLFFYWLVQLVANLMILYSRYRRVKMDDRDVFRTVTATLEFVLVLTSFVCDCFADQAVFEASHPSFLSGDGEYYSLLHTSRRDESMLHATKISPESKASYLSKLVFVWIAELLIKGYRQPLIFDDLYTLGKENSCRKIIPKIEKEWNKELVKAKNRERRMSESSDQVKVNYQRLKNENSSNKNNYLPERKLVTPSFSKALFHAVGYPYIRVVVYKLIFDLLAFVEPLLLGLLIKFIANPKEYTWHGYFYALCFFGVTATQSLIYQNYFYLCYAIGMRARTAAIGVIYRKALKLSPASRNESTVGEIVNLMSVDCQKLQDILVFSSYAWSCIIVSLIGIVFLWRYLGPSVLAGFAFLIFLIPANAILSKQITSLHSQQMKIKDCRMKLINEILNGMKIVKLYAWEKLFERIILQKRNEECHLLKTAAYFYAVMGVLWFCSPFLVTLCTFYTYILSDPSNILTVSKAFISLTIFNTINIQLTVLPEAILSIIQAKVSLQRINKFLLNDELDPHNVNSSPGNNLTITNGTFSWKRGDIPVLKNINIKIHQGSLVAIVGAVGSGKSSFASALIGDMFKESGEIKYSGPVAYVPQQAWCLNTSVRDNILFNKPMDADKYNRVIEACALSQDLKMLPSGDQTEIGERGINLSGGQKQRISLARAVYRDSSIYILDDPLSAVDSHVGKHIFDQVIGHSGLLSGKTRILITHKLSYLPKVDKILFMEKGRLRESGTFSDLLNNSGSFTDLIQTYFQLDDEIEENNGYDDTESIRSVKQNLTKLRSRTSSNQTNIRSSFSKKVNKTQKDLKVKFVKNGKMIKEEFVETSAVKFSVYLSYIRSATYLVSLVVFVSFFLYMSFFVATNVFLSKWTESQNSNKTSEKSSIGMFLKVYGGLGAGQVIFILIQNFVLAYGTFLASKSFHKKLLKSILRAPNIFFDTTPLGRILNRIGGDIDAVDTRIFSYIRFFLFSLVLVMGIIVVIMIASPYFIIAAIPLLCAFILLQRFYMKSSSQLKRIDAIKRSPIYSHFQESLAGDSSIRAFKVEKEFIDKCDALTDENQTAWYMNIIAFRWLPLCSEFIGNIIIFLTSILAVVTRSSIGVGFAGLSISFALEISSAFSLMIRYVSELEIAFVSVERIQQYVNIEQEAPWNIKETKPDADWPTRGQIEFVNYSLKYRPDLDLVLRGLNFVVRAGEKLGIVGRTGAGKSSLALGLFRLIEPSEGSIFIDGIDINKLGLHELRSRISIIPQDPVIFSGTLRMNLDPFNDHSDDELWTALDMVHLKPFIFISDDGLDFPITENGDSLSTGQKQLICLARVLLKRTKILVLDEATSAIDLETDDLIQKSIREQFRDCTVLTIAHRINTIMDYDRVLVLQNGNVKELDTPQNLLRNTESIFFSMVKDAGLE